VIAATVLYTLLQVAFIGAINWSKAGTPVGDWTKLASSAWASAPFAKEMGASSVALLTSFVVLLNIDAWVSPSGTGLVYTGTSTRTIFGLAMDGYLPPMFRRVSALGIPVAALVASLVIGWIFLLPLPSWYLLVGFISSATVLTYIMGGVGLTVFRRTAPNLHRPVRLRGASVLAPVAFVAAALVVYWSGTSTLNYVVAAVFVGLPLYAWSYAPAHLGVNRALAGVVGLVFLVAILFTGYMGPFYRAASDFSHSGGLSFPVYVVALLVEVAVFAAIMWSAARAEHKREIVSGLWFIGFLFATYVVSYLGAFGPRPAAQQIAFPLDTVIEAVVALIFYYLAVGSGYRTDGIAAITEAEGIVQSGSDVTTARELPPRRSIRCGACHGLRSSWRSVSAHRPRCRSGLPPGRHLLCQRRPNGPLR